MASSPSGNGVAGTGAAMPLCPTYQDDFLPRVNAPVCKTCHDGSAKLPNWGNYSQAATLCTKIGSLVASGAMPPASSGLTLTAEQKSLVSAWVGLGCPQTSSDLPQNCHVSTAPGGSSMGPPGAGGTSAGPSSPSSGGTTTGPPAQGTGGTSAGGGANPSGAGGTATNPPSDVVLSITRAEWDADKQTLRLEGDVSDYSTTLRAEFSGRVEPLANDMGRFRNEFTNVATSPATVTVTTSAGASTTSSVTVK